ncbi:unnamed protein product [Rotaria sp. Silwood1]|nr:unnamed protein product [Rotaria sp. Silwood1]CAF3371821.1 unnamed protein product [Rotaria sp. Silwood1]CAF3414149.1 unnamed protein product [Rotaria sp. Silwood1]CAF3453026.1 unnamed protein product [Rotaria sp. Silwood1]CAF4486159.1 unnamed protein product [Rotaria sp. Silwood1]
MEYMTDSNESTTTTGKILCCQCGVLIEPNALNMCNGCMQTQIDITEQIPKQGQLQMCNKCIRYLQPPNTWISAQLESRELLTVCLKRIKGLNKEVRLIDAGFIWTEPHSKRIKVKLTVQKEVAQGAILQQTFIVEFTIFNQICDDCQRVEAKDYWKALVQVRQRTSHKKTFFYLEQLLLKHNAHADASNIKQVNGGLDFYFAEQNSARKLADFLMCVVPCRFETSKRLISHDIHSNIYNYKYTTAVEIAPICKDDIVCLSKKQSKQLGNIGPLCICSRVTQNIYLIDPKTLKVAPISANDYWRSPFTAICDSKHLVEYIVCDVNVLDANAKPHVYGKESHKHVLAEVFVIKASEIGIVDKQYSTISHLGHILHPGDTVMGFDLQNTNVSDSSLDQYDLDQLADVILVKKVYADKSVRNRRRQWKLKHLDVEDAGSVNSTIERDYTEFLEDLEEDPVLRQNINVYRDEKKLQETSNKIDDATEEDLPHIELNEMLADMTMEDSDKMDS